MLIELLISITLITVAGLSTFELVSKTTNKIGAMRSKIKSEEINTSLTKLSNCNKTKTIFNERIHSCIFKNGKKVYFLD